MVKLFQKSNSVSAKDYIEKKRNKRIYCDTNNNNTEGRYIGKFYDNDTKRLQNAVNHSSLLKITKGMFDHRHAKKLPCYFHNGERKVQTFNYKNSTEIDNLNTIKATNYTGERLTENYKDPNTDGQTFKVDNNTKYSKGVRYASIQKMDVANLEKDIVVEKVAKNQYPIARLLKYKHSLNDNR